MAFLVECQVPYVEADLSTHVFKHQIPRFGEANYAPNPKYGGRRVVEFDTREQQEAACKLGGGRIFVVPTDLVSVEEEQNIRRIVRDELAKAGVARAARPEADNGKPAGPHATNQAIGLARRHEVDLEQIEGTGEDGKVTKEDVERFVAGQGAG